jgi:DNA-binding winged helix-turn-helix (wHTH) protein/Tol biopolymer transport system component
MNPLPPVVKHPIDSPPSDQVLEYVFGPFRLDVASMQLSRDDEPVNLTPKAFDTLLVLIHNRHRLVRKDELMSAVWADAYVSEDSLTQNITALRRALGDDSHQPEYISTIPRRGYRFIAPLVERGGVKPSAAGAPAPPAVGPAFEAEPPVHGKGRIDSTSYWRRSPWAWAAGAALAVVAVLAAAFGRATPEPTAPVVLRFSVNAPRSTRLTSGGAVSPDRRHLAFIAQDDASGVAHLWVQALDEGTARVIEGTDGAAKPFWSPDSQAIGFFAAGTLRRVSVAGGPVQTLAPVVGLTVSGGSWGANDVILFASFRSVVNAVPASGGEVTAATHLDAAAQETAHRWPQFLPDGRFLFSIYSESADHAGTYVGALGSNERIRVLPDPGGMFAPTGHLLYVKDRVLMAQAFGVSQTRVTGATTTLAGDVFPLSPTSGASVSAAGEILTYGGRAPDTQLVWFSRSGERQQVIKAPPNLYNPSISQDLRYLLAGSGTDVWLIDLERDAATRIGAGNSPLISPDGTQIAFTSGRLEGVSDLYLASTVGRGEDRLFLRTRENKLVNDWSHDGRYLVFASTNPETRTDLWVAPTSGGGAPVALLTTSSNEFQAQISPDGRWIAYASDESGRWEVYVQSFPVLGAKRAISIGGGSEPQWRRDGRELFYIAGDGTLMAVDVTSGSTLQATRPRPLFRTPIALSGETTARRNHYVAAPDGQRFLVNASSDRQESITVLVNWTSRLRADRPASRFAFWPF